MSKQEFVPQLTIATTLYRSQDTVEEFYHRSSAAAEQLGLATEFLFVDDGSPDSSAEIVRFLATQDSRIRIVHFTRNFGHTAARLAAMDHSRGDMVFLIDCDLEEEPEWLLPFLRTLEKEGADVVFGVQERRKGSSFEKASGYVFYWLIERLGRPDLPRNPVTARLMKREYVECARLYTEKDVFLAELWHDVGLRQVSVTIEKGASSPSTYTVQRKLRQAISAITSVSVLPIYWVAVVGGFAALIGTVGLVFLGVRVMLGVQTLEGWSSVMASIWIFGGLGLVSVATVGLYVSKIFNEVRNRPRYVLAPEQGD